MVAARALAAQCEQIGKPVKGVEWILRWWTRQCVILKRGAERWAVELRMRTRKSLELARCSSCSSSLAR